MLFETIDEYDDEIGIVQEAIRRQILLGKDRSYSSGGASRSESEIELKDLRNYMGQLQRERAMLDSEFGKNNCGGAFRIGAGW